MIRRTDETCQIAEAETAKLLEEGFDVEYLHRDNREGFKAGALAEGMERAKGEYIFILDADFVPAPDVLKKCIDYFTDDQVGMVQMRWGHLNRNYSLLTKVQAMFLDGHLLLEQTARSRSGRFFTSTARRASGASPASRMPTAGITTRSPRTWISATARRCADGNSSTCRMSLCRLNCPWT